MENGTPSQQNSPLQRDRLGSVSQTSLFRSNSLSPDDGYDYRDAGPSPEGSATKEKEGAKSSGSHLQTVAGSNTFVEPEKLLEEVKTNIFERPGGGRRAKVPDEENLTNGFSVRVNDGIKSHATADADMRKSRWNRHKDASVSIALDIMDKTKLRHVMLQWEKEETEETDGAQRLVLKAKLPGVDAKIESPNHVIWQHSELDNMRLDGFERIIAQWNSRGLQESETGLTRRVLKRVRTQAQRPFIGGSFLTPIAIRYDILDDSRYNADKCCIFLNFPYFTVAKPQGENAFAKGDPEHPMRTLLQSHYRLNETSERDKMQCIRLLTGETLKSCIDAPDAETAHLDATVTNHLVHVPQMWALVLGLNKMITLGPISDLSLQGSSIKLKDDAVPQEANRCAFVRISFLNQGSLEELTYPLEQCASWFGLMNKHQHIRNNLEKGSETADPKDSKFHIGDHVIQDRTWASVQRSVNEEVLDLWMKTPKPNIPKVSIKGADSDSDVGSKVARDTDEESGAEECSTSGHIATFARLEPVPFVSAFLSWQILDEFGEPDDNSHTVKTNRFLIAIYRALPATCEGDMVERAANASRAEHVARVSTSARSKISIAGRTLLQVDRLIDDMGLGTAMQAPSIEQKLRWSFSKLFNFFVPADHNRKTAPIQLFWGALYELLVYLSCLFQIIMRLIHDKERHHRLNRLHEKVEDINRWAEKIHLGVHEQHTVRNTTGCIDQEDAISEHAILLASMVDALGAVFNMIVEAVRDARIGRKAAQGKTALASKVSSYGEEACSLLETARDELIKEATGSVAGENVGPVLTPEAILIMLMERLVHGVFGSGTVEVIAIYEECLEHLALKVKSRASRRLLQTINAFEEEVAIVNDVLLQQKRVLLAFRDCLDPAEFKRPSTARKMRFEFEKKGIGRILTSMQEQLRYCAELRARAKVLAIQNVHLVETAQDDNGRAIFIFTFITVLFLPLSFVAGFFGMNVQGINPTTSTTRHFWVIALPVTAGIMILCGIVVFKGESIWFAFANLPRTFQELFANRKRKDKRKIA